jgi:hypothetical protein
MLDFQIGLCDVAAKERCEWFTSRCMSGWRLMDRLFAPSEFAAMILGMEFATRWSGARNMPGFPQKYESLKNFRCCTVFAALLFGALRAGGLTMQASTDTPLELVLVIQALVVLFIAAPALIKSIFRLKNLDSGQTITSKGWNG